MESVPLIPKASYLPHLDVSPLIRELFQDQFQSVLPSKALSQNISRSLQYEKSSEEDPKIPENCLEICNQRRQNLSDFAENVLEAYVNHEKNLEDIGRAEKNVFETHACYLRREMLILENKEIQELLKLKRQPLLKALDSNYVNKYKLLQGEAGLPPQYEAKSDFRVQNFKKWRRTVDSVSQDSLIMNYLNRGVKSLPNLISEKHLRKKGLPAKKRRVCTPQAKNLKKEKLNKNREEREIFRSECKVVFFTEYKPGDVYVVEIKVKNVYTKGMSFQIKPMCPDSPFTVILKEANSAKLFPGLSIQLSVQFAPKSLDNFIEEIYLAIEDGNKLLIPLVAYLDPPILKTHKSINEFTRITTEKIESSYIECGACFTGDTKVTKVRFRCYQGCGEFFVMSSEDWYRNYINTVTFDNLLEIPPFRVYPVFFKIKKNEVIDLFVEFLPKNSGMHVENIVIACNNGEVRSLDLLADAVGWHSYFFSFEDSLLKELPVDKDDDLKVKYFIDFHDTTPCGKVEKVFRVSNNSNLSFEFQWKIRDANISANHQKYFKLSKNQVKIDPERGTFEPNSIWEFLVTITFNNAEIGDYRMVLSLYVLNLPYQCIEEDNTVIQPTGLVRNLYSQSLYGEEEYTLLSPELLSLQGTYESLQDSIKSYVECQGKAQGAPQKYEFCKNVCLLTPGLCAKPLKKSKTYFNIGDNIEEESGVCTCQVKAMEGESVSESCTSNLKDDKLNELSVPRNEIIWDFVDILVDEIELWVEVSPTRITLRPSILSFSNFLKLNDPPVFKKVQITNYNRSPVTCKWLLKPSNTIKPEQNCFGKNFTKSKPAISLLFDNKVGVKDNEKSNERNTDSSEVDNSDYQNAVKEEKNEILPLNTLDATETQQNESPVLNTIITEPQESFTVPGLSDFFCNIGLSVSVPGKIREELYLSVNDGDLELTLIVLGNCNTTYFEVSPNVVDFGVLKQGTRQSKYFKITNENTAPLFWKINEIRFDFEEGKFWSVSEDKVEDSLKREEGVLLNKGSFAIEPVFLTAKIPGIRCSILEIQSSKPLLEETTSQYVLVLGDIKMPVLSVSSPRFENAILAPTGMMYIGKQISTKVILTNKGSVETNFTWGHPFGCHCRKLKVEINPRTGQIGKQRKLINEILLTPLDEGIISHCYVPCFFGQSAEPLILSIVGMAENINVTFEIIDYPSQTHADTSNFLKSPYYHTVLRVAWPMKNYNPNLGQKYIKEEDILNMTCQCLEVEEEANRAFGEKKQEIESEKSLPKSNECSGQTVKSASQEENSKILEEDFVNADTCSLGIKNLEENSLQKYSLRESSIEALQLMKCELEFLNVPFQTPISRQFVIRNETPVDTVFRIGVMTFGEREHSTNRILTIRDHVLSYSKVDDFKHKLMKEQPLLITVEPSEGTLLGFDAVCINVFAYGNTWGEYRDSLFCEVKGIQAFHLRVFVQLVGHPINFPMFDNSVAPKPTLRFQPVSFCSQPISKNIRVLNRSAIPLTVSWIVFLTEPLLKDEENNSSTECDQINGNLNSIHSGEQSSNSTKIYLPKNASGTISPSRNFSESREFNQYSASFESSIKTKSTSEKNEIFFYEKEKSWRSPTLSGLGEDEMSETLQFSVFGNLDSQFFKVDPKEMTFEPFEEKKLTISFDPHFCKFNSHQEFKGALTGCVKLKPEDEKCFGVYYRPCGMNFVSELLNFHVFVETPLLSFELLKQDLKFWVDSNDVIKSPLKQFVISRRFLIKNINQKTVPATIEVVPGMVFRVKSVSTMYELYEKYNPDLHRLKIEAGQPVEVELECLLTYEGVMYAYEQLKLTRRKETNEAFSNELEKQRISTKESENSRRKCGKKQESFTSKTKIHCLNNYDLCPKDSFEINVNRMSSKSDNSVCYGLPTGRGYFTEAEGEFLELPLVEELPSKPKPPQHVTVIKEEINFVQKGLITQTLVAELHLSFPLLKMNPKSIDFGNVYVGEKAVRYCCLINLTGFPIEFTVKSRSNVSDFVVKPLTATIPPTNYSADIGKTISIEFKPSQPRYFKEVFQIYGNQDMEFDCYELAVAGIGTWNEKYKWPKLETYTKLRGVYSSS